MLEKTVRILALFVLLIAGTTSKAQDTAFRETIPEKITFSYDNANGADDYRNPILRDLSLSLQEPLKSISFTLRYDRETVLTSPDYMTYELVNTLHFPNIETFTYRSMDISGVLLPGSAELLFSITDTSGIEVRRVKLNYLFNDTTSNIQTRSFRFFLEEPFVPGIVNLLETRWTFSRKDYEKFRKGVNRVDDYFAAGNLLNDLVGDYRDEFPDDPGFMQQVAWFLELERVLGIIDRQVNHREKVAGTEAEKKYIESFSLARRFMTRMKTLAQQQLRQGYMPDSLELRKKASLLAGMHNYYFILAENTDHRYTTYYSNFAEIKSIGELVSEPWSGMLPAGHHNYIDWTGRYKVLYLNGLLDSYLDHYYTYDSLQDYYRALVFLQNASMVYSKLLDPPYLVDFNHLFTKTERGMVNAYKRIIDKALETDNLYIADIYFKELMKRLKMSGGYPKFDTILDLYSSELAYSYLEKSGQLNFGGNAGEALVFLNMAEDLCMYEGLCLPDTLPAFRKDLDSLRAVARADKVMEFLNAGEVMKAEMELDELRKLGVGSEIYEQLYDTFAIAKYNYYASIGDRYMMFDEYRYAWWAYVLASGYDRYLNNNEMELLFDKMRLALKPVMLDYLNFITPERADNEYGASRQKLLEVELIYQRYFMQDNAVTYPEIDSLMEKKYLLLEASRCSFVQKTVDSLYKEAAKHLFGEGKYLLAREELQKVEGHIDENPDCNIDRHLLERRLDRVALIETYHEMLKELNAEVSDSLFVKRSFELDDFYLENELDPYIKGHSMTLERVIGSEDEGLMGALLDHYSETSGDRQALEVLWGMRESGIRSKDLGIYQSQMGRRLAESDFEKDQEIDPYVRVNDYTLNYSFFKDLRRSYLERWAELSGTEKKTSYFWRKIRNFFRKK